MQRLIKQFIPFIFIGIAIVAFIFGIMLLAYLFFFGAIIGLILFIITWIREKFFPVKTPLKPTKKPGRTIDSNDWKEM
ncbi:MAG: hypothetical protein A3F11_08660 [Gammaproteobacteria bacterium RIFCSPHIGHO2_12_FULL_37_14]|nr:MAG: hypothetical protein A3F11_08660 [Gammaproteobacteria bacterium RIFCSPHIGHO2_12_FULL_37_14]